MRVKRTIAVLGAIALFGAALPLTSASAGLTQTFTVKMGLGVPKGFSMRVLAPTVGKTATIRIHEGDTVNFKGGAILLPVGQGPQAWKADYATDLDSPFGNFASDPDPDLTAPFPTNAAYKFGLGFIGQGVECGADQASQCEYDGSDNNPVEGILYGGDRFEFGNNQFVQINAEPGETIWAMSGFGAVNNKTTLRIQVVPPGDDTTTQAAIDAAKHELADLEKDTAVALDEKLRKETSKHTTQNGTTVWDAYAGFDTATIALIAMYPTKLVVEKGDKVRWHFSQLQTEDHTVTFPFDHAKDLANNGVVPVCDPDGGGGEGPDTFTVDFETISCTKGDGELELDLTNTMVKRAGDGEFPGGKEHSGVRGSNIPEAPLFPPTEASYDLKFTDTSSTEGYRYACAIHGGFMDGFVIVKP